MDSVMVVLSDYDLFNIIGLCSHMHACNRTYYPEQVYMGMNSRSIIYLTESTADTVTVYGGNHENIPQALTELIDKLNALLNSMFAYHRPAHAAILPVLNRDRCLGRNF